MLSATSRRFSRAGAVSPRPRNRNYTLANAPPPPAVKIRTHDMISPLERRFLEAAEKGDKPTIQQCLDEVVELLLQQPNIRIGNALLCAIREGVYRLVEIQVNHPSITREMLGDGWSQQLDPSEAASAEYSSDISPVILAAQLNQFEILQMLLRKEATIERPHRHSCMCETCDKERLNDSLQYSLKRINTYRALASPAWMSLTSSDPILSAFKLSWDLQRLAFEEHEFKETYLQAILHANFSSAYYIYVYKEDSFRYAIRTYWTSSEPMLVAEALFAVGNVFSFARIIYLFQTNPYLGPLQISLGCMLVDVAKFCFIFVLIISSFSIGLAQLYWYYDPDADNHQFTQWVGRAMFILYHCTSIIVLLNMLIAMMSHSFQIINDHADLEWKFHRTKLWMAHFDEGSSLAPPFNLVITPKSILYFFYAIYNTIRWLLGKYTYTKGRSRATIRRPGYSRKKNEIEKAKTDEESNAGGDRPLTYADIIQRLVARFIHQTKKDMKMDGVNEDDLLEIKQDISSLRYELRDDRRREIVRSSSHIDAVKRDIMRTMSSNSRRMFGGSCRVPKTRPSVAEESFTESEETTDEETKLEEKEEDEKSHTSLSLLYSPPPNTALPEIVEYGTGSHSKSKERKYVPKMHSVLRKTDTSFTFPKAGGSPTRVTIRDDLHDLSPSLENAINNIRRELNDKLDQLNNSLIEATKTDPKMSSSQENK
ncbi:hypothetical protein WR25_09382 [Diploscapter pachys]|uniref:Transient receptor ion channel domain-containing protein n=1 Tax=Diploscapter pachys TaxID=2018661 RepID=A0A2A2KPU1_9BILA|nr:hypothetical protein WR25_09382 [Diploscapter pachys]